MSRPLVSIIMNCYNCEKYLNEAINSVINQSYQDWEIIFWDNRSTDGSFEIISNFHDKRIAYHKSKVHTPLGAARVSAVKLASGVYIAFLDCDDMWIKEKLDIQVSLIESGDYCYTYAGHFVISHSNKVIGEYVPPQTSEIFFEDLVKNFNIDMVTPLIKKSALIENVIAFNEEMHGSEEINLFLRLSLRCSGIAQSKSLGFSRRVDNSLTHRTKDKWHLDARATIDQLIIENPTIEEVYPEQIRYLRFKECYFKAKWLMLEGRHKDAKKALNDCNINLKTLNMLKFLAKYPSLWKFLHSIKEKNIFLMNFKVYRDLVTK